MKKKEKGQGTSPPHFRGEYAKETLFQQVYMANVMFFLNKWKTPFPPLFPPVIEKYSGKLDLEHWLTL